MLTRLKPLLVQLQQLKMDADTKAMQAKLTGVMAQVAVLANKLVDMKADVDVSSLLKAEAALLGFEATAEKAYATMAKIGEGQLLGPVTEQMAVLQHEAGEFADELRSFTVDMNDTAAVAKLDALVLRAAELRAAMKDAIGGDEVTMARLTARFSSMIADYDKFRASLAAPAPVAVTAELQKLRDRALDLRMLLANLDISGHDELRTELAGLLLTAEKLRATLADASVGWDPVKLAQANYQTSALTDNVDKLRAKLAAPVQVAITPQLATLRTLTDNLTDELLDMRAVIKDADARARLDGLIARSMTLREVLESTDLSPAKMAAAVGTISSLTAAMRGLVPATEKTDSAWDKFMKHMSISGGGFYGLGGTIAGIGAWHVALDGIIEAIIAVSGALIAFGAGVAALSESAYDVGVHLQAVRTVSAALGQDIPPLTGKFDDLMTKMKDRTITMFGAAVETVHHNADSLMHAIGPVVNLLTTWVVEMQIWIEKQGGFSGAITHGMGYLEQFGAIIGQLTEAIHNLLTKDPGIAHYLLQILVVLSGLIDAFTKLPKPIVEFTIGLHGIYIWASVLGAVLVKMLTPLGSMVMWVARIGGYSAEAVAGLTGLSGAMTKAGTAATAFGNGLKAIITSPLTWFIVAAAAIAYVAYEMWQGSNASKAFVQSQQDWINSLPASQAATQGIAEAIRGTREEIYKTQAASGGAILSVTDYAHKAGSSFNDISYSLNKADIPGAVNAGAKAVYNATRAFMGWMSIGPQIGSNDADIRRYTGHIIDLTNQQQNLFREAGNLVRGNHSMQESFALMDMAGVTASDSFAVMKAKVDGLVQGYKNMGIQNGLLNASVNAVTFATLQQTEKVQQLNQGWDAFMKTVEGGESAFVSFATQTEGLYQSLANGGVKLSDSNGKVSMSTKLAADAAQGGKVSMTGLNTASLQARDTFLRTADAANAQMDSLTTLANAAGLADKGTTLLTNANKDLVAAMLPAAKHSQVMTDVLYALAQRGGYRGADSFKALSEWVGKTRDPMKQLDGITTTLTTAASDLTTDVKNLSIALGTTLNDAMAKAILQAGGGQQAFDNFATAVLDSHGQITDMVVGAAVPLAQKIYQLTGNVGDARKEFMSFAIDGLHMSKDKARELWNEVKDNLDPKLADLGKITVPNTQKAFETWAGSEGNTGMGLSKKQARELWTVLSLELGPKLDGLTSKNLPAVKNAFIAWAEQGLGKTKAEAETLWKQTLPGLQAEIDSLHGKNINVTMQGKGQATFSYGYVDPSTGKTTMYAVKAAAAGWRVPGWGGGDRVPAMLEPGETVLPKQATADPLTQAVGAKYRVPGFAAGGVVAVPGQAGLAGGDYSGNLTPAWIGGLYDTFVKGMGDIQIKIMEGMAKKGASLLLGSGSSIVQYALSFLGQIPYVWGGESMAGADCSGFTRMVLSRFGYNPPRTSEAQGGWVTRAPPTPGGLAFYHSPPGGPDPGHVAIIKDAMTVISQGGGMGPTLEALSFLPLLWTGVPPGGFRPGSGPLGPVKGVAGGGVAAEQAYAFSLFPRYGWGPDQRSFLVSLWNRECVSLSVRILTRRGWLTWDEVRAGEDETIGYNPQTKQSEWTRITAVHQFGPTPVARFGNQYWSTTCTWNHRWLAEQMGTQVRYGPRPERKRLEWREVVKGEDLTELRELRKTQRVVLARQAQLGESLPVSTQEAALLGWIAGDGWVTELRASPEQCPECGWLPFVASGYSDGRVRHEPKSRALSVRSHRVRKHGFRGHSYTTRRGDGYRAGICQSKPEHFASIEEACSADPGCTRGVRPARQHGWRDNHTWNLSAAYSRDLLARAGNPKTDAVAQVLAMSSEQREAWLDAITAAEGTRNGNQVVIYQDDGPVADAIELAIYLSGRCPSRTKDSRGEGKSWSIRSVSPYIGGQQRNRIIEDAGAQETWCPTTELGTWTAQDGGRVFLTGNSNWNPFAVNPNGGAYGIPQAYPPAHDHPYALGDWVSQINWGENYIASAYGSPDRAWAHEQIIGAYRTGGIIGPLINRMNSLGARGGAGDRSTPLGRDSGGALPPGLSLVMNGTGADETIIAAPPEQVFGYAAGGVAGYRERLAAAQAAEASAYARVAGASHRGLSLTTVSELGTLARRQAAEVLAYRALAGSGLTHAGLRHLRSMISEEERTSRDIGLRHIGGIGSLQQRLAALNADADRSLPHLPAPVPPAAPRPYKAPANLTLAAWWDEIRGQHAAETDTYADFRAAWAGTLAHARPGSWVYRDRGTLRSELATLDKRQRAFNEAFDDIMTGRTGGASVKNRRHLIAMAHEAITTTRDKALQHWPGGHLYKDYHLAWRLGAIASLAELNLSQLRGQGDPSRAPRLPRIPQLEVRAGEFSFDRGGVLSPGWNAMYNGTGRDEHLVPAGSGGVHIHVHNDGVIGSRAELDNWLSGSFDRLARQGRLTFALRRSFSAS